MALYDFDVGIIGGGPAGGSMAAYLARAGVRCVVFEKELFPRPHVGESLVPSSTRVFRDLDFLPTMEEARFPHKFGAVWTATASSRAYTHDWEGLSAEQQADIRFEERDQPGVPQNYTYHVDRGLFDNLLLQHANEAGADVYEGVNVRGADIDGEGADIRYLIGRKEVRTRVRIVVDASGRRTLLGNQMKWRIRDDVFDQYAIHTWFDGFDRLSAVTNSSLRDYIFVHFLPVTNSWIWQIPITDTITSIGVVTQKKHFAASRESREAFFWDCVRTRPELYEGLRASTQVRPLKDEGDYSYAMNQLTADRLLLVGDAARFVDPIFSTGVSIALNSARFASRDVIRALETGDFRREAFSTYEATLRRGTRNWYNFISVYYRLNVLFTAFILDPRYRLDVLQLLQGDVYDEVEPPVLGRMRRMVTDVEQNPEHVWHALLGDLTANAFVEAQD
ncbi:MAG: NAD(P)/FAD-dependent oxidoreductase [Gemmatimonadetes bacterium]|nr:NAD(P)/FAD-dependent oxidoreductase [Gemmatimonadota bacterium]